jgi:small ligand-binding sensory domain FIST
VARAFSPPPPGEDLAKAGQAIDPEGRSLPLAGFFAAGEIGPVGQDSYLHGQTACLALFRNAK